MLEDDSTHWPKSSTLTHKQIKDGVDDGTFKIVAVWDGTLHTADKNPGDYKLAKPSENTTKWMNGDV